MVKRNDYTDFITTRLHCVHVYTKVLRYSIELLYRKTNFPFWLLNEALLLQKGHVGSTAHSAVVTMSVFWDITLCSPLKINRRFGLTCRLHFEDRRSRAFFIFHADFLLGILFDPEDGGDIFLRNFGRFLMDYTALYPRRLNIQRDGSVGDGLQAERSGFDSRHR
jgi:hypothetical protein